MNIVVTGGGGFIGSAVIEDARAAGHDARAFDRSNGQDILGDLSSLEGADSVIHLAGILGTAELFDTPEEAVNVNVIGTLRVLEACRRFGAGFVGISMPPVFPSVYTATKVCASRLSTAWHIAHGIPVSHVCAYNAYGPGQKYGHGHPQKIIPTFSVLAWQNKPIPVWGNGEQGVDLVHTDDVARMLVDATQHGDDVTFDAGTGVMLTVNQVANFVLDVTGSDAGIEYLPMRPGEIATEIVASGQGWDRLGWKPEHDWERLAETVQAYKDYQH